LNCSSLYECLVIITCILARESFLGVAMQQNEKNFNENFAKVAYDVLAKWWI